MSRYFNTSGPCVAADHYMLPPGRRLVRLRELVDQRRYLTLVAGRQTGKTTSARWLVEELNRAGRCAAAWIDLENAREKPEPAEAIPVVLNRLDEALRLDCPQLACPAPDAGARASADTALQAYLGAVCANAPGPLVLLFDEVDSLVGPAMVSFLTQLRAGYLRRTQAPFPASVALIGQRRVRDYMLAHDGRTAVPWLGTTSPFNIEAESLTLGPFAREEVAELLSQHTQETGQRFEPAAVDLVFELSQGHPWLVNALAYEATFRDVTDRSVAVAAADVETGRARIVRERRTHLDSLGARLRDERVRRVLEPMIVGGTLGPADDTDIQHVVGLGLVRETPLHALEIANPVYREIVLRQLSAAAQPVAGQVRSTWTRADGGLDADRLLDAFLSYWTQHAEPLMEAAEYPEAAPHVVMHAFLHRVENGGGRLDREYAVGTGRMDLCLRVGGSTLGIELKVWKTGRPDPLKRGLVQLDEYLAKLGPGTIGWLVIFDRRRSARPIEKRTRATRARTPGGRRVVVIRA